MDELPSEVLCLIFAQLPVKDWLASAKVNREWRREALRQAPIVSRGWRDYKHLACKHHMVCEACGWRKADKRPTTGQRECFECRKDPDRALITKTRAMREFNLKPSDFEGVACVNLDNPYNNRLRMYLFRVYDLKSKVLLMQEESRQQPSRGHRKVRNTA